MTLVATLIAAAGDREALETAARDSQAALDRAGANFSDGDWLAPGEALDLSFEGLDLGMAKHRLGEVLYGRPIDFAVQEAAQRRASLLVADLESTIIAEEMLDVLADLANLGPHIAAITARAMAGELDFAAALEERVSLLAGLPQSVVEAAAAQMTLNPGARILVATLKAKGCQTALVSGGFRIYAEPIARACGFDRLFCNELAMADGRVTGALNKPFLDRAGKSRVLLELAAETGIDPRESCALGDGSNDVDMLSAAGIGVAYRGKPPARAAADICLDHGDLSAVLYFMGYHRSEFVET